MSRPAAGVTGPEVFAGLFVADYAAARPCYERLLGSEPAFLASDTEAVWQLGDHRWLYIKEHSGHAGHGEVTIFPEDLDAAADGAAARGVVPARREDYPGGVRKIVYRDADGNEIGFGGA